MGIKVKATIMGIYGGIRRREGAEFTVRDESELARWMERLDGKPHPKHAKAKPVAPAPAQAPRTLSQLSDEQKAAEGAAAKGKTKDGAPI